MNQRLPHAVGLLALLLLAGCSSGQGNGNSTGPSRQSVSLVTVTTDETTYHPGDQVGMTISNQHIETLYYNACIGSLEILDGSAWIPGPESLRLCSREAFSVEPGGTRQDTTDLDLGLPEGVYRLVLGFSAVGASDDQVRHIVSNPFTIRP